MASLQVCICLEELLALDPDNLDLFYNLASATWTSARSTPGRALLHHRLLLAPQPLARLRGPGAWLPRAGDLLRAYTMRALAADPRSPIVLQEPGRHPLPRRAAACGLYATCAASTSAIHRNRRPRTASPSPLNAADIVPAQKHFQALLEMKAPEELHGLARNGLREIATRELKARGPRMDAVFYLLDAMRLFRGKSLQEIQEITLEIGLQGQYGLDINDPQGTHLLRMLPGRTFSALELVCIMNAGLKMIEPGMDIGVDLSEEWGMTERLEERKI